MYTILHIETSTLYQTILRDIVYSLGVSYVSASSSIEAYSILTSNKIDLILTAMHLADMDAKQFLTEMNDSEFSQIPVVILTGDTDIEDRKQIFNLGIIDYLNKNSTPEEIKNSLQSYIYKNKEEHQIPNLKFAVIDDSRVDCSFLAKVFSENNINQVDFYTSGLDLLNQEKIYNIYLIDLVLEHTTGSNVILKLREKNSDSIIIAISGIDNIKTISNILALGANDYINKPFNPELLMARIKTNIRTYLLLQELNKKNDALRQMVITDGLTRLYNHKHTLEVLDKECQKAKRYQRPMSIIMFDLDHFKSVNDNFGHITGDKILSQVAGIIHKTIRETDSAGRYGGEEFLVVLPETTKENAKIIAERIREKVSLIKFKGIDLTMTISGGLREYNDQTRYLDFLKEADELLYLAKTNGRNRIEG